MVNHQFLERPQASSNSSAPVCPEPHRGAPTAYTELGSAHMSHQPRQKKRGPTSPPPLNPSAATSYLWPECVTRPMMSRRLSATVAPVNSARSAAVHLPIVVLMAAAHLSIPPASG